MSVRIVATSMCSSFRIQEVRPSGPAAFPRFNLVSCFVTPQVLIKISGMTGDIILRGSSSSARGFNLRGTRLVKAD